MRIIPFLIEAIKVIPEYFQDHKVLFLFTMTIAMIAAVYHMLYAVRAFGGVRNPLARLILTAVEFVGSIALLIGVIVFNTAGETADLRPELLDRQFFIEIIVCAVFYSAAHYLIMKREENAKARKEAAGSWTRSDEEEFRDMGDEQAKAFFKGIAIALLSLIGFFFGTAILDGGPVLFGKTLGTWAFSTYAGWTTNVLIFFAACLIEYPLMILVGNRQGRFMDDAEEAIDRGSDIAADKFTVWFDKISAKYDHYRRATSPETQKKHKILAGAAAVLLIIVFVVVPAFRSANLRVQEQKYSQIPLEEVQQAAQDGNAAAQAELGYRYYWGQGLSKSVDDAAYWFNLAAAQKNAYAERGLGMISLYGELGEASIDEAILHFEKAAKKDDASASNYLGAIYSGVYGGEKNLDLAIKWYKKSADDGNIHAFYELGKLYLDEESIQNSQEAAKWFKKGQKVGQLDAATALADLYRKGNGVEKDYEKAFSLYKEAAEDEYGPVRAQYHLAVMYEKGRGTEKNLDLAKEWYKKAADRGSKKAEAALKRLKKKAKKES